MIERWLGVAEEFPAKGMHSATLFASDSLTLCNFFCSQNSNILKRDVLRVDNGK